MRVRVEYRIGISNVETGTYDYAWIPNRIRGASKYPVMLLHGASGTSSFEINSPSYPSISRLAMILATQGIPVVAAFSGGNHYANEAMSGPSASSFCNKMLSYISSVSGCSSAKAIAIGVSMGGGTAVRWSARNPTKSAGAVGLIPMSSINRLYTENPGGVFTTAIGAAWGVTPPAALPGGVTGTDLIGVHAPLVKSANIPGRLYYAPDDSYINPSDVLALASAAGFSAFSVGNLNHTPQAIQAAEAMNGSRWSDLVDWIKNCGA